MGSDRPPVFAADEVVAYEALMQDMARSADLDPAEDATISKVLNPASRAVVFAPSFLPAGRQASWQ